MPAPTAVSVTTASVQVRPAMSRNFLGFYNQSATAVVYVAFDTAAVAAPTAGQFTIGPQNPGGNDVQRSALVIAGPGTPHGAINIIGSAAGQLTIVEG